MRLRAAILLGCALVAMPACSSGGDDDDGGGAGEDATGTTQPANTPQATGSTQTTGSTQATGTSRPEPETATPPPSGPPAMFEPGQWTSGEAEVTISGGADATFTGTLLPQGPADGRTIYLAWGDGPSILLVTISTGSPPFEVAARKDAVQATFSEDTSCEITYSATEEDHLEATFRCERATLLGGGEATVEGTFWAKK